MGHRLGGGLGLASATGLSLLLVINAGTVDARELTMPEILEAYCDAAKLTVGGMPEQASKMIDQYRVRYGVDIEISPELTEAAWIARQFSLKDRLQMARGRPEPVWRWVYTCAALSAKRLE